MPIEERNIGRATFSLDSEIRDGVEVNRELKAVWKVLLCILEEFIRICEKFDLRYYMDGGSLLGTVRHKGFIPWDDDIDVAMPREDYDKLIEIINEELSPPLIAQNSLFDKEYTNGYSRIVNCDTCAINHLYAELGFRFHMGIGLDIFPIDPMPENKMDRDRIWRKMVLLRAIRHYVFNRKGKGLRFIFHKVAAKLIWWGVGGRGLFAIREGVFRRLCHKPYSHCATCPAEFGWAKHSQRECVWYDEFVEMPFEYLSVRVPKAYDILLTQIYGEDWRVPKKGLALHDDLIIETNRSYTDVLKEKFGYK